MSVGKIPKFIDEATIVQLLEVQICCSLYIDEYW
jgi:hypothetical protein